MIKPWRFMTDKEIAKLKETQCRHCAYFSKAGMSTTGNGTCDYILIEKHSRGCLPTECMAKGIFRKRTSADKRKMALSI